MDSSYNEITNALVNYLDGFYEGDTDKLRQVFHPDAHLFSATDGPLVNDDMEAVYARVEARPSPAGKAERRHDRILSIDKSGPEAALAKVQIAIAPKLYTDYLSLLKLDGRWQIISKTYTHVPLASAEALAAE